MVTILAVVLKLVFNDGYNGAFSKKDYTKCKVSHYKRKLIQYARIQMIDAEWSFFVQLMSKTRHVQH